MKKAVPWIVTAVAILWCIFIWQFSLRDAGSSSQTSGAVLRQINHFFSKLGLENLFTPYTIRKTAHFCEFLVLGVLASAALCLHGFRHFALIAPGAVFLVGGVDEILQIFSPGRGPSFLDVLLDTAGGVCGILLFSLTLHLILSLRERRARKNSEKTPK